MIWVIRMGIRAAIIGASGYTGAELVRLLYHHPDAEIVALAADKSAGQPMGAIYPHLAPHNLPPLVKVTEIDWKKADVVFCCLPHAASQEIIKSLPGHLKIIDLSADFRLSDVDMYAKWYGHAHQALELQKEAVYGLSEIYREKVKKARLVANPGCYPTSATLPLVPLLKAGIITADGIVIDSKSGISGAGRSEKLPNLFCEVNESVKAYGVCNHRHLPEIEQTLTDVAGQEVLVQFTPHIIPMSRGMMSDIYVKLAPGKTVADIRKTLENTYKNEPFVGIAPEGYAPTTREVSGTNMCLIGVFKGRIANTAVLVSVIDNLIKGASGQAVQNMNIMFGIEETAGLQYIPVFP